MTYDPTRGWQAQVVAQFAFDEITVAVWRRLGDCDELITRLAGGESATITQVEPENADETVLLRFPRGVLEAIAEMVKPGPGSAELAVLREALDIERRRVDGVLGQ